MPEAKLFFAILSGEKFSTIFEVLQNVFGEIDIKSEILPFTFTDYYEREMGRNLNKVFVSFRDIIDRGDIVDIKLKAMKIEEEFSIEGRRRFNLDPGYLTLANVVLSTRKDYSHRIYLGRGVFAEVTLIYSQGKYRPLPWTYKDYTTEVAQKFFVRMRRCLQESQR